MPGINVTSCCRVQCGCPAAHCRAELGEGCANIITLHQVSTLQPFCVDTIGCVEAAADACRGLSLLLAASVALLCSTLLRRIPPGNPSVTWCICLQNFWNGTGSLPCAGVPDRSAPGCAYGCRVGRQPDQLRVRPVQARRTPRPVPHGGQCATSLPESVIFCGMHPRELRIYPST